MWAQSEEFAVPWREDSLLLPPRCVIRTRYTLLSVSITLWIFGYILSFHSGTELHWNRWDQPEHQCQSHCDLLIPAACRNIILIKSLSSLLTLTIIKLQLGYILLWLVPSNVMQTFASLFIYKMCSRLSELYVLLELLLWIISSLNELLSQAKWVQISAST